MKTLITGGAGFVGFHLSKYLVKKGEKIVILDNLFRTNGKVDEELNEFFKNPKVEFINLNLSDKDLEKKLGQNQFNKVYHLASINGTRFFYEIPDKVLKENIIGTINILDWFSKFNNKGKILLTSSSETYAGTISSFNYKIPTDEKVPLCIEDIENPRWSYGLSKVVQEALFNYTKKQKTKFTIARLHNPFGERMGNEHVIPQFIQRILNKENPFKIYGSDCTRSFCYIGNEVEALYYIMESKKCNGEIINVGSEKDETRIKDLALKLFDITNYYPKIQEYPAPKGSVKRRCPSIKKLKELTGFENKISLEQGLKRTYNWYKENYSKNG